MRINHNMMAMTAYRSYSYNTAMIAKSIERLSTGYRINRAADDPAGLAISEKMRAQIRGLNRAARNCQDALSLVQTAEGALQETHNILQRMRELAVQAASDTNDAVERAALDAEFQALLKELEDTKRTTRYNDLPLLDGSYQGAAVQNFNIAALDGSLLDISVRVDGDSRLSGSFVIEKGAGETALIHTDSNGHQQVYNIRDEDAAKGERSIRFSDGTTLQYTVTSDDLTADGLLQALADSGISFDITPSQGFVIQSGPNAGDQMQINIEAMSVKHLGLEGVSITTRGEAGKAIGAVEAAIKQVASQRANLGATQNRLEHKIANLENMAENLQDAESRIRDVDIAKEMAELVRYQILAQAAIAMMAQANTIPQMVLQLLQK